jgi:hypothetical protein
MHWLDTLQWPAMAITVVASWLVGSRRTGRRNTGFATYLAGNALWIAWGWHVDAAALVVLQLFLMISNVRGLFKTTDVAGR